ncbi:ATP-binding protein [Aminipila terrae]|uniref:Uncharacterized protein n=1 Tax=Aminipila terrae TaxID=2697030 RepID=A0A6P1MB93_9FIRM|nr:ATP-binding protein [Aminipila terrae]QHI71121.1 hypothetical protein Ami3637_00825 [Aminipila terrae]
MNTKRMSVNPRIIEHLGSDLITSSSVAIVELIKNSIDAKSKKVHVQLFDYVDKIIDNNQLLIKLDQNVMELIKANAENAKILLVEDIGIGMNDNQLENGFLNIGTDIKFNNHDDNEAFLGEKGIGRLATQRLGKKLILETASKACDRSKAVIIDWKNLIESERIDNIELPYYEFDKVGESYTRLWIIGIEKNEIINEPEQIELFNETNVSLNDELQAATCYLVSPFKNSKNEVEISFYNNGIKINTDFDTELLDFAESKNYFEVIKEDEKIVINLKLELTPMFIEKTHRYCIKPVTYFPKYRKSKDDYISLFKKYRQRYNTTLNLHVSYEEIVNKLKEKRKKVYSDVKDQKELDIYLKQQVKNDLNELRGILPITGCAYNFKQDNAIGKMYVDFIKYLKENTNGRINDYSVSDIQNFLNQYSGIKLYRNSYRIGALGNRDDDWLEMQQYRTSGQQFYRINQSNTVGYVSINDPLQVNIREISSRLDIVQNNASKIFKEVIIYIFNYYFYDFNRSADDITKSILQDEGLLQDDIKKEVKIGKKRVIN